ncbi:MAG: pseudaminic acid cytidylyltransferase [Acidobacteriota bacterium]|nr:pseudaminic acid cytidylyltransferase [Acidobacteriota bacterium]
MNVAVIPARGGSKRIPRKNIRAFCGRPILAYPIEAAEASNLFSRIIVSTDDNEIAEVARAFGAEVPFVRPAALADDHAGTNAVVRHAVAWMADAVQPSDLVCCLYPTAPFVTPEFLGRGYDLMSDPRWQYAISVTSFAFPIQRALRILPSGGLSPMTPEFVDTRSQDLEPAFHDAGQFYWGRPRAFLDDLPDYAAHSAPVVLPRWMVQDIDTEEDWETAERLYRGRHRTET